MRLVWLMTMTLAAFGQMPSRPPMQPLQEIPSRPAPSRRPVTIPPAEAPCDVLVVSSSLYQPDQAQPVMREYGQLPATIRPMAVVGLRDGRVLPVSGYWVEDGELVYVSARKDRVRRVAMAAVDVPRSERLNRQRGMAFRIQ
jgi:hypothetical protein